MTIRRAITPLLFLALAGGGVALAGANKIPHWSMATDDDTAKAIKTFGFTTEGKADAWPKKVAIPWFVVRYDQKSVEGDATLTTVKFPSSDYTVLTDALYDHIAKRLTDAGFEVVPKEKVLASAAYAKFEGDTGGDEGSGRYRGIPTGMKYLGARAGQPTHPNDLAALNKELGTDAVVAVYANFGLCPVDLTGDTGMSGTKPCLHGNLTLPGLSMLFLGGSQGEGSSVKPTWTSRAFKDVVMFTYAKATVQTTGDTAEVYDAALVSPLSAVNWSKANFWGDRTGDAEVGAYAQGVDDMLDVGFTLAMETFYDKNAAAITAAGKSRPARAPAPAGSQALTMSASVKEMKAEAAAATADLEKMKADMAARPEGAATAGGTILCYQAPPAGASQLTILKRGYEATRVVDEQVVVVPNVGPAQMVVSYQLGAGTFAVADAKSTFSGTGTFEGTAPWTTWKEELAFSGNYSGTATGTTEGTGFRMVTDVKDPTGKVVTSFDQHFTLLDSAACDAAWASAMASAAPAPGGKKKK